MGIILLGPPGAGKGTQAVVLAKELGLPHISTGEILRQNVTANTALGKEAQGFMNQGLLVPDDLVNKMLMRRFQEEDVKKGFILDGYPRNLNQAKTLEDILEERKITLNLVVYLDTSDVVIIQRLTGRLVCKNCGTNFHIKNMPPKRPEICDNCGGALYQRKDDSQETVKKRIEVYKKEIQPLIEYYGKIGKLERLSADAEAKVVLHKIIDLAKEFNDSHKN